VLAHWVDSPDLRPFERLFGETSSQPERSACEAGRVLRTAGDHSVICVVSYTGRGRTPGREAVKP
jgi:hypothetical protein